MSIFETLLAEEMRTALADDLPVLNEMTGVSRYEPSAVVLPWAVVLLDDPAISTAKLAELLSFDSVLASGALAFANAPKNSMTSITSTIDEALMRLGLAQARGFVLAATLPYLHLNESETGVRAEHERRWKTSLATAVIAREVVKLLRTGNADEVYAAALIVCGIPEREQYLPQPLRERLKDARHPVALLLAVNYGVRENWPQDWLQAAFELYSSSAEGRGKLSETLWLASFLAHHLREEPDQLLATHSSLQESLSRLTLSEASLQKLLASSKKRLTEGFKRFGIEADPLQ